MFPRRSSHANGPSQPRHTRKRSSLLPTIGNRSAPCLRERDLVRVAGGNVDHLDERTTSGQQVPPTARTDRPSAVHAMSRVSGSNPARRCAAPPSAGTSQRVSWLAPTERGGRAAVRPATTSAAGCLSCFPRRGRRHRAPPGVSCRPDHGQHAESRRDRREPLAVRRPHRARPDERRRGRDGNPARRPLELAGRGEPTHDERLLAETGLAIGEHGPSGENAGHCCNVESPSAPASSLADLSGPVTNRFAGLPLLIGRASGSRLDTEMTTHSPFRGGAGSGPGTAGVGAEEMRRTTQKATKANTAAPTKPAAIGCFRRFRSRRARTRSKASGIGSKPSTPGRSRSRVSLTVSPPTRRAATPPRCSRTRTLAGLMPSTLAASSVSMSSQSTRISASR